MSPVIHKMSTKTATHHQHEEPPSAPYYPPLTTVDGIGQWDQWKRNFKAPVLALLDLMDNAFDASHGREEEFQGHVHVYPDKDPDEIITGLVILNNSCKHIKPMAQILVVYQSSKGSMSESIGENGVGLKQGCATLADLSFALSKNLGQYSLGILAKSLQRNDGCVLPSYSFPNFPQKQELQELFLHESIVGACIAEYGDGSLENGIERLLYHYQSMVQLEDRHHVFCVVLHNLKHNAGGNISVIAEDSSDDEESNQVDYAQNAVGLMQKLRQELPRQYIHVSSSLDVQVDGVSIVFSYWQRRMVELSSFEIKIDPKHSILKAQDWKDPVNGYSLKIYCGFDPIRLCESSKSPASLFVYSRQSGRLILHSADCRSMLGLNPSGSDVSQGLTIILDDFHGNLPLSPTKQDLAFGEESHGEIHEQNLYNWLSGVARVYYNCHLGKMEDKKKEFLTAEIKRHLPTVTDAQTSPVIPKPLPECNLSTLINVPWYLRSEKVTASKTKYTYVTGVDTFITIREPAARKPQSAKKDKKTTPKKRKSSAAPTDEAASMALAAAANSLQPRKRAAINYNEDNGEERARLEAEENELLLAKYEEIGMLKAEATRLRESKKILKDSFRGILAEVKELRKENASLKKEQSHGQRSRMMASKSTLCSPIIVSRQQEDELLAANRKIEELQKALKAAEERAEDAETETEIQQEIANDLRKKAAELRRAAKHASP